MSGFPRISGDHQPTSGPPSRLAMVARQVHADFRQSILDSMTSSIAVLDCNAVIVAVNTMWLRLASESDGATDRTVIGVPYHEVCPSIFRDAPIEDSKVFQGILRVLKGGLSGFSMDYLFHSCAKQRWFNMVVAPLVTQDNGVVITYTDISEDKFAEAEIHRLVFYDPLTQLPNRRLLQDRLGQALAASARSKLFGAIYFINLDNFKILNDTRGHDIGDLLLKEVALRLRDEVRNGDTVARQGDDEFVVLMENLNSVRDAAAALAKQLGDKLQNAMERPFDLKGDEYHCKLSIGVSLFHEHDTTAELFKYADLALSQAKKSGRNTLRFFDPAMQSALVLNSALETELRQAVDLNQLQLYYQPQVDMEKRMIGVEALLRWQHPLRGCVLPDDFIPLAEETGLILRIGRWVLEAACAQISAWENDTLTSELQIAVNVSARQFRQPDFVAQVQSVLTASAINPARLKLELTESVVLENVEDAIAKMLAIKLLGVGFSLDDFGTGYSSLSYLSHLPIDQIKIDRSFVRNVPGKNRDENIVRTIISMGLGMDMNVIAEGVETEAQQDFLEAHGCHAFQGYLFGRPQTVEQLDALMKCGLNDSVQETTIDKGKRNMKKILLVDDSTTILLSMSAILTKAGYETDTAASADEGLTKLKGGLKPDLLITDLNMPGMNGIEFIKEVRKLPAHRFMPILFLTTESQQSKRDEAKAAGASGWLVKPVEAEQLVGTIKLVIK